MTTTLLRDEPVDIIMAEPDEQEKSVRLPLPAGGYLFTPPENTVDSFSQADESQYNKQAIEEWQKSTLRPIVQQTPPASPQYSDTLPDIATATGLPAHDSPLFPEQTQSDRARAQVPLFEKESSPSPSPSPTRSTIHAHVPEINCTTSAPQQSSSGCFPFNQGITTGQLALQYYHARMEELRAGRSRELPPPKKSSSRDLDPESRRQLQSLTRVEKSRSTVRAVAKPKAATPASPAQPSPPKQRRTPKVKTIDDFYGSAFPAKEATTKHKRAPPSKKVEGENVNWTDLPDYAPPTSELDNVNSKPLKVQWHGHKLPQNDNEPDREYLHEQEVEVAATLRLTPQVYLTNKRKIFQARLQALKDGKNFTKTAAQSACKIDVNKASQLWEAFDKVGWFEPKWYQQYL